MDQEKVKELIESFLEELSSVTFENLKQITSTLLAGTVEYADCFSAEE